MTTQIRYAGLHHVHRNGLTVEACTARLQRLAYAEERLMLLQAAHLVTVPEWDLKLLLGRLQFEDVMHADQLKRRLTEMRVATKKAFSGPDPALEIVFNEAMFAANSAELLAALTWLFKPALLSAYQDYLNQTNHLADYPTVRILKMIIAEEKEALSLLEDSCRLLIDAPHKESLARSWVKSLTGLLNAAGGIDGSQAEPNVEALTPIRATQPYVIPKALGRDDTFTRIWDFHHVEDEQVAERLAQMIATRLSEITAAEGLGYVLWETRDQPWPFYTDISRHLWDEVRHTLFGEVAAEDIFNDRAAMPMRIFDEVSIMQMSPMEMYAMLGIGVEAAMMKYPPGKRQEFEFCQDTARYPLMATFQDFDWADEVLHVTIARRQLKEWFDGNQQELLATAQAGVELRARVRQQQPAVSLPNVGQKLEELQI